MVKGETSVLHVELIAHFSQREDGNLPRHLKPYKGPHQLFSILFWHEHVEPRISLFDQDKL